MPAINWIWIWRPEFYSDGQGNESPFLTPASKGESIFGTCHPDTEPGQLVILYRTSPKKDVAYLLRTTSPALVNEDWRPDPGVKGNWTYMAEFEVVAKVEPTVKLSELRSCRDLEDFGALRRNMWGSFFKVEFRHSKAFWKLFSGRLPRGVKTSLRARKRTGGLPLESELESAMVDKLDAASKILGRDLRLWTAPDGTRGRQLPCSEVGGRLDLLCEDQKTGDLVLIELKVVKARVETFGQICSYIGWVKDNIADGRPVKGIVVADGKDAAFQGTLSAGLDIKYQAVRPIARKLGLID
ncbi:MAG: endonuclease NucS [Verrucomicrobiales bacterium]|nr:endonuclease NucS [Verrucomicrobiales bacterium]